MSKIYNDSSGVTSGFAAVEVIAALDQNAVDPGSKPSDPTLFAAWVKADQYYKEYGQSRIRYT